MFVAGAIPGDRVRAVVHKRKRSYAHARTLEVLEPSPERIAPHGRPPWRALAGAPVRAPAGDQARAGRRGAAADRPARGLRAAGDRAGASSSGAIATSSSTRSESPPAGPPAQELVCGFHAPAGANRVAPIEDCLLASERGNLARERRAGLVPCAGADRVGAWRRRDAAGAEGDEPAAGTRRAAPGDGRARRGARRASARRRRRTGARGCATWSCAKAGTRASCRSGSSPPTASSTPARSPRRSAEALGERPQRRAVDALAQPRRDDRRRRDRARVGRGRAARARWASSTCGSPPRRSSRPTPRWPSCCTGSSPSTPRSRAGSACTTCTRDRHDRAHARSARGRGVGDRARRAGGRGRDRRRRGATRSRTPTSSPATRAWRCPSCSRAPGARTCSSSIRPRAGLSKKVVHRIIDASPQAHRLRLLQPHHARPQRRRTGRGGVGAAQGTPGGHVSPDPPHRVRGPASRRGRRRGPAWRRLAGAPRAPGR